MSALAFVSAGLAASLKRERDDAREKLRALVQATDEMRAAREACDGHARALNARARPSSLTIYEARIADDLTARLRDAVNAYEAALAAARGVL